VRTKPHRLQQLHSSRPLVLLLVVAISLPVRSPAQPTLSHADSLLYHVLAQIGEDNPHTFRILNHEGILVQGRGVHLMGDSVVMVSHQKEFAIAVVDVDSLWMQRGTAALALGVLSAVPCALFLGWAAYTLATGPDGNPRSGPVAALSGGAIGGIVCGGVGAVIGSFIRVWRLEYARPVKEAA
jgi:hypothetical protein